jgi:putative ABC transport system permease protein
MPPPAAMIGPFHGLGCRLRDFFQRRRLEAELAEEIRVHLEMQEAVNRSAGLPAEEAGRGARQQFGGVDQFMEGCRDQWGFVWLDQLVRDGGFACRALAKSPGFVFAVVSTLAVAIGAAAALVNVALQVLHPSLPFADPPTLMVVQEYNTRTSEPSVMTAAGFARLRARATTFSQLAAQHPEQMNLVVDGRPVAVKAAWVTPDFFRTFGVSAAQGRTFAAGEHLAAGGGAVAVLAHRAWVTEFGSDPAVLGRTVLLGGRPCRIVGVMPESFVAPIGFPAWDVFLPTTDQALGSGDWWQTLVWAAGRLKPGVRSAQAEAELATIGPPDGIPAAMVAGVVPRVAPVRTLYRADGDRVMAVLLGAGAFLYAMACANAFNLVLMRTVGRRAELGVRAALGGCRERLFQLLVVENLLLVGAAGVVAALLSRWFGFLLVRSIGYWWLSAGPVGVHGGPLLALVGAATLGAVVAVGIAPAGHALRAAGPGALAVRTGSLGDSRQFRRWRSVSAVAQAALAVVMLVGASLFGRTLVRLVKTGVGFDPARRIAVIGQLPQPPFTYPPPMDRYLALAGRLQEEFARLPGVERSALASSVPLFSRNDAGPVQIDGRPAPEALPCSFNRVSPEYFSTLGVRMLRGRGFGGMKRGDPGVVVVNETMARAFFPGEDPLGRRLDLGPRGPWHEWDGRDAGERETWEIIGVAADVRDEGRRIAPGPQCYVPFWQRNLYDVQSVAVVLQLQGPPVAGFAAAVRGAAFAVDPELVISDVVSLEERAASALRLERCASAALGVVAGFALVLAGLGLFTVVSALVAERQREFGVRLALGARPDGLQWLVLRRGLVWTGLGVAVGLGASWAFTRILQTLLFATDPHDPAVFGGVALFVFTVAGFACWLPARRAARIDPMIALRAE